MFIRTKTVADTTPRVSGLNKINCYVTFLYLHFFFTKVCSFFIDIITKKIRFQGEQFNNWN